MAGNISQTAQDIQVALNSVVGLTGSDNVAQIAVREVGGQILIGWDGKKVNSAAVANALRNALSEKGYSPSVTADWTGEETAGGIISSLLYTGGSAAVGARGFQQFKIEPDAESLGALLGAVKEFADQHKVNSGKIQTITTDASDPSRIMDALEELRGRLASVEAGATNEEMPKRWVDKLGYGNKNLLTINTTVHNAPAVESQETEADSDEVAPKKNAKKANSEENAKEADKPKEDPHLGLKLAHAHEFTKERLNDERKSIEDGVKANAEAAMKKAEVGLTKAEKTLEKAKADYKHYENGLDKGKVGLAALVVGVVAFLALVFVNPLAAGITAAVAMLGVGAGTALLHNENRTEAQRKLTSAEAGLDKAKAEKAKAQSAMKETELNKTVSEGKVKFTTKVEERARAEVGMPKAL